MHPANVVALVLSIVVAVAGVYAFRTRPAALIFIPFAFLGGPVKGLLYDVGWLRKSLDVYPFSRSEFNSVYGFLDVLLVVLFLVVWFWRTQPLPNREFCHRLRMWAVVAFVGFTLFFWAEAVRHIGSTVANTANKLYYNPEDAFIAAAAPLWSVATAVLVVVSGSRVLSAVVLCTYGFTSTFTSGFGRGPIVIFLICLVVLTVQRLRLRLVAWLLVTGVVAASLGALTRGTTDMSAQKVLTQAVSDVPGVDQTVSYFDKCGDDIVAPRAPWAFAESFWYGFKPRFLFPEKPKVFGNHIPELAISPRTAESERNFDRTGRGNGFFPVSIWVECFYDMGLVFGLAAFFGLAAILRWVLHAARTNIYAWIFTLLTVSSAIGMVRGGSNWLMINLKATLMLALMYAPLEWLLRQRRALAVRRMSSGNAPLGGLQPVPDQPRP
jgi:hypothetical protein